jgi:hypothetical protein
MRVSNESIFFRKPISIFIYIIILIVPESVSAAEYWSVKAKGGIHTTIDGTVAINIGNYSPSYPSSASSSWVPCKNNWIFFNKTSGGTNVEDKYVDRMLSVALAAYKTDSIIRVGIDRDSSGYCYTMQIFDQGM